MILIDISITGNCKCCGNEKNVTRILCGKWFDSAETWYLCEDCRKDLYTKLGQTILLDKEPTDPHGGKWFQIWYEDKEGILATMYKNLAADLDAGYNYNGTSIQNQLAAINQYTDEFNAQVTSFADKDDSEVSKWCYYDLKKRGAI